MSARKSKGLRFRARIFPAIFRRLRRIGITVEPFLTVREGEKPTGFDPTNSAFGFGFLAEEDNDELIQFDKDVSHEELCERFREGKLCYGVRDGPVLVAKMWCDLNEFSFPPNFRKLEDDEVYLFAASARPYYRGQNVAPLMRSACYASLQKIGRTRFYSYSDYFNTPARRFKEKLGARDEALKLHVGLFGKWSKTMTVKRYS